MSKYCDELQAAVESGTDRQELGRLARRLLLESAVWRGGTLTVDESTVFHAINNNPPLEEFDEFELVGRLARAIAVPGLVRHDPLPVNPIAFYELRSLVHARTGQLYGPESQFELSEARGSNHMVDPTEAAGTSPEEPVVVPEGMEAEPVHHMTVDDVIAASDPDAKPYEGNVAENVRNAE